jgi:hypothetical protein
VPARPTRAQGEQFHWVGWSTEKLPEDAQNSLKTYETERDAIEKEIDAKLEARRQAVIKELEALQERYTKAGKLDEAVAIRDFLKAGGPQSAAWRIGFRR